MNYYVENIGEVNEEDINEQVVDEGDLDLDQPSSKSEHIQLINKVILNLQIISINIIHILYSCLKIPAQNLVLILIFSTIFNSTFFSSIHQILPCQLQININDN